MNTPNIKETKTWSPARVRNCCMVEEIHAVFQRRIQQAVCLFFVQRVDPHTAQPNGWSLQFPS